MTRVKFRIPLLITLLMTVTSVYTAATARAAEVSASLSAREAYVGAPVTLTVRLDGVQDESEPVIPEVDGLEIRSLGEPSWSSRMTIINGRRSDSRAAEYAWHITPQREGTFTIPSITVRVDGTEHATDSLRLVAVKSETGDLLFVEIDGYQRPVYVGQPVRLMLKIWLKPYRDRQHGITLSPRSMWDAVSLQGSRWNAFADPLQRMLDDRQLPRGQEVLRSTSDGKQRAYYLYEIETTLYPRRPGEIRPGDVRIVVQYPTALQRGRDPIEQFFDSTFPFPDDDPFFSPSSLRVSATRPVVAAAEVPPIAVAALPTAGQPDDFRGAVGRYEIVTQATPTSVQAGDPITLNIGIRGDGPMELVQAPPLHQYAELTADFKVPDEPLPGIVNDSIKLFSVSIRPRHADVRQIPAIPFSYFDTSTEKYVTIYSEPIQVQVEPAENLAFDSIVAADGSAATAETPPAEDGPQLTNDASLSLLQSRPPTDYRQLAWILLLPPLAVAGTAIAKRGRSRLPGGSRRRALRSIRAAGSPAELYDAVRSAVGAWMSTERSGALTRPEVVAMLQHAGRTAEAVEVDQVLAACERMLYAGQAAAPLAALKLQAQSAVAALWRGGRPPHRNGYHHGSRGSAGRLAAASQSTAAVALLIAAGLPACSARAADPPATDRSATSPRDASADVLMQLTDQQHTRIFVEANQAYQRGQAAQANDIAQAKQAFASAAEKYRMLVDAGIRNDRLYVNLGNAYLQSGQRGWATAAYLRATQINPANRQARGNLRHIQQSSAALATEPAASDPVRQWLGRDAARLLPQWIWFALACVAWATLWGVAMLRLFRPLAYARVSAVVLILTVAVCGAAWSSIEVQRYRPQVVAADQAVVRTHNGDTFPEVPSSPVPAGTVLQLLDDRQEWLHVRLDDGATGWMRATQSARL